MKKIFILILFLTTISFSNTQNKENKVETQGKGGAALGCIIGGVGGAYIGGISGASLGCTAGGYIGDYIGDLFGIKKGFIQNDSILIEYLKNNQKETWREN